MYMYTDVHNTIAAHVKSYDMYMYYLLLSWLTTVCYYNPALQFVQYLYLSVCISPVGLLIQAPYA